VPTQSAHPAKPLNPFFLVERSLLWTVMLFMGRQDPFILFRERADVWCAAPPGFRDPWRDPIGRGRTRVEAVRELLAHPAFVRRAKMREWPLQPGLGAFVEVFAPDFATFTGSELSAEISNWQAAVRRRTFKVVWERDL
jgi:hypothetical protein